VLYVTLNVILVKMVKNVLNVVEIEKKHLIVQLAQLVTLMMDLVRTVKFVAANSLTV